MMRQPKFLVVFCLATSLLGVGCFGKSKTSVPVLTVPTQAPVEVGGSWLKLADGFERLDYRYSSTTDASLILYRIDPSRFSFRLASGEPKRVSAWAEETPEAVLVANGSYFHEDDTPSGFLAVGGKRIGDREFDDDKSGLLMTQPSLRLIDTLAEPIDLANVREGMQSYPFLVKNGEQAVATDSGLVARRTFIGTDTDGRFIIGLLEGELSLFDLGEVLLKTDVRWDDVLNLDGGPSSGVLSRLVPEASITEDSIVSVPFVLLVSPKKTGDSTP